jgi:hypothetical protein
VKIKLSYSHCAIITNVLTECPLCGGAIEPMVKHECSSFKKEEEDMAKKTSAAAGAMKRAAKKKNSKAAEKPKRPANRKKTAERSAT